ncbi:MAG TPA: CYTH and CHAD domain-containing protein [Thermohalobaculum sp.]|nr:CYTH and CHAD domain-containing protein [Thermohalobaculum sp.]
MDEVELKFVLDGPAEKRLRENPALARLAGGKAVTESLHTIYYDTADRALKAAGIALRLRRKGRRWVQTVKAGRSLRSGLSRAAEAECPVRAGRLELDLVPDPDLRAALKRHLDGRQPEPVCETRMRRTRRDLVLADGARIELAIDVGEVRAGGRAEPWREAELELRQGAPAALFAAARLLLPEGGLEFSGMTKAERGYLLAEQGRIRPPLAPRKARAVPLRRRESTGEAAAAVLRECLDQVAANALVVAQGDDPEGPHQLRVGLRRLRAALAVFGLGAGTGPLAPLNGEARWLGQEVGRLRDLDVVRHDIIGPEAGAHPGEAGFATLMRALADAAREERARLRTTLKSARVHGFLLDLAASVETPGWADSADAAALARPVPERARAALAATWKRTAKRAGKTGRDIEALSVEQRHELRKALKRLRYAVEFCAPLFPAKAVRPFLKRLRELQDLFGDLNDVAVAEALFSGPDAPGAPGAPAAGDPAAARAIGLVIGARRERAERAWASARAAWQALSETPRFWA